MYAIFIVSTFLTNSLQISALSRWNDSITIKEILSQIKNIKKNLSSKILKLNNNLNWRFQSYHQCAQCPADLLRHHDPLHTEQVSCSESFKLLNIIWKHSSACFKIDRGYLCAWTTVLSLTINSGFWIDEQVILPFNNSLIN